MRWNAVILGPENSPWDGGTFKLVLEFSEDYPNKAPVVKFVSKMFHPNSKYYSDFTSSNYFFPDVGGKLGLTFFPFFFFFFFFFFLVYADGSICLDILQNNWSPIYDVAAILTSIQSLLTDPNPNSPANSEAARLFTENREEYTRQVKLSVGRSCEEPKGEEEAEKKT